MLFGKFRSHTVNLALQGGGAHGAYTWGVLDYLLEDGRVSFDGVSGSSAGAMNAAVLANGLMVGGRDGARAALEQFWQAVARSMPFESVFPNGDNQNPALAPALQMMLQWTQHFSPTQLNPFDLNPLRDILVDQIDFYRLRTHSPVKLFVATTNANSGKIRLFREHEIGVDSLLASACLPAMHHTIQIDGESYWDGGYAANPAIYPLFYECKTRDILLILLAPLKHKETPVSAQAIKSRISELSFNSTFLREMRMFAHMREYLGNSWLRLGRFERRLINTHFHIIEAEELMNELSIETKLVANTRFFSMLKEQGRTRAKAWLQTHYAHIGSQSSVDILKLFY